MDHSTENRICIHKNDLKVIYRNQSLCNEIREDLIKVLESHPIVKEEIFEENISIVENPE